MGGSPSGLEAWIRRLELSPFGFDRLEAVEVAVHRAAGRSFAFFLDLFDGGKRGRQIGDAGDVRKLYELGIQLAPASGIDKGGLTEPVGQCLKALAIES